MQVGGVEFIILKGWETDSVTWRLTVEDGRYIIMKDNTWNIVLVYLGYTEKGRSVAPHQLYQDLG